jgi:Zn-dependent peptidase ImmA (M78 family)
MIVDWPVLSDDEIERQADDFRSQSLESLALNSGGAVPIEQIAEQYLGYELEFVGDDGALPGDVIGGIDFDANTIIINSSIESHLGRYSFTIAHEIAHHVLHRDLFLKARSGASIMCRGGKKRPIEEVQADRFAEALLMPANLIEEHHRKVKNENIFISKKAKHRVLNESKTKKLMLIEVQTGTKFLESDIKRYSDIYGRSK